MFVRIAIVTGGSRGIGKRNTFELVVSGIDERPHATTVGIERALGRECRMERIFP